MKKAAVIPCLVIIVGSLQAQEKKSVVIGDRAERPSAVLFLNPQNKDQGFLLPQLTSQQRANIRPTSPADDGLMVFDTDDKLFYFWKNNSWTKGLGNPLPDMSNQAGKFISTDGVNAFWSAP